MALYRGPGGAGDATNNATSQAILAAASAVAAASSEAAAASSATSASNSATAASSSASAAASSEASVAANASNAATSATNAASSATAAANSATAAATSETNAASSASAAATSATNAANSATSAANSATTATTQATNASNSAIVAATSATNAANSATAAVTSETNAASSASAASTSATNAANSATSASNSASTATTQATNAASSATAAATSATNAATSETNAAASATSAASSATSASSSATSASNSASSASTSATNAAASAVDAQSSEDAAAAYAASINPANFLTKANNLSDLTNTSTARTNLGVAIGTNVQAYSSELQAISNGGGNAMFKNRIINGAMVIDQRNAGASVSVTDGAFSVDRFKLNSSVSSKYTAQRSTTAPAGFTNSLLLTSSAATTPGAADYYLLDQRIEGFNVADLGFGTANASNVTLSFWVRSSLTGTFGFALTGGGGRSYVATYTVSSANTYEYKTITIPGDTGGTWPTDNSVGMYVRWDLGCGTNYDGTAGSWASGNYYRTSACNRLIGTNGATFYITGVQLEKGSTATSFDYRPYGTELALCQRYYQKVSNACGSAGNTTTFNGSAQCVVTMRATPSVSANSVITITKAGVSDYTQSSANASLSDGSPFGLQYSCINFSGLTQGQIYLQKSSGGFVLLSSEL